MKKWLVLVLALVMVLTSAAGIASGSTLTPESGAKLIVWESEDQYAYMYAMAKAFTAKTKIPVTVRKVEIGDQISKATLLKKGDGKSPDVMVFPHDKLGEAVASKAVVKNDVFAAQTAAKNLTATINAVSFNGALYGYPKSVESVALIYNKKLIASPPKTWDDVIKLASNKKLHDPVNKKYVILWDVSGAYHSYFAFGSQGGYVYGNKGTNKADVGLASAGSVKSLTKYKQVRKALYPATLQSGSITGDVINGLFQSGKVAMTINGPWAINDYQKAGISLGVAKIPAFSATAPARSFSGVRAYYVSSKAMYPKAAKIFANWATEKYAQTELYKAKKAIPATKEAANSVTVKADPIISGFNAQYANATPMPNILQMGNYWGPAGNALKEIFDKNADPKAAATKAANAIKTANSK